MTEDRANRIVLRIPRELHQALKELAKQEERSVNAQILFLLRQALNQPKP